MCKVNLWDVFEMPRAFEKRYTLWQGVVIPQIVRTIAPHKFFAAWQKGDKTYVLSFKTGLVAGFIDMGSGATRGCSRPPQTGKRSIHHHDRSHSVRRMDLVWDRIRNLGWWVKDSLRTFSAKDSFTRNQRDQENTKSFVCSRLLPGQNGDQIWKSWPRPLASELVGWDFCPQQLTLPRKR